MKRDSIKNLTYGGLMTALVFIATYSIKIPVPFTQGYIHAGDSMIFIAGILLGWKYGALAGGLGSALADILGGYANWALPTFVIKAVMGAIIGFLGKKAKKETSILSTVLLSFSLAVLWFSFSFVVRKMVLNTLSGNPLELVGKVEGGTTLEEILKLSQALNNDLFNISILVPIGIIIVSLLLLILKKNNYIYKIKQALGMAVAGLWMIFAYYIAASIMYGSFIVPIFSIPWNFVQFFLGLILASLILSILKNRFN